MNLVALETAKPAETQPEGKWFEVVPPADIAPQNLYQAQLQRRLTGSKLPRSE
jgi:hypothetical protein